MGQLCVEKVPYSHLNGHPSDMLSTGFFFCFKRRNCSNVNIPRCILGLSWNFSWRVSVCKLALLWSSNAWCKQTLSERLRVIHDIRMVSVMFKPWSKPWKVLWCLWWYMYDMYPPFESTSCITTAVSMETRNYYMVVNCVCSIQMYISQLHLAGYMDYI